MEKYCHFCDEHSEIKHAVLGSENNSGLVQEVQKLKLTIAFVLGILGAINFIWVFFGYPWLMSIVRAKS